jgi:hypothetical protein
MSKEKLKTSKVYMLLLTLPPYSNALARSTRIRKSCEYLPEDAVRIRKSYFCKEGTGYFNKQVPFNPMAGMMNPDMMSGMLKQNI